MRHHALRIARVPFGVIVWGAIAILTALVFVFFRAFHGDELEAVHTIWKIAQGEVIFRDFFQHHHPFLYYVLVPVILFFGETLTSLFVCRAILVVVGLGIGYYTYKLSLRVYDDQEVAVWSLFLLFSTSLFVWYGLQIRPDVPMVFFLLVALYQLYSFFVGCQRRRIVYSGVAAGVAMLFLQKAIIPIGCILILLSTKASTRKIAWTALGWFLGSVLVIQLPYYYYLWYTDGLWTYYLLNWLLNSKMLKQPLALTGIEILLVTFPLLFWYAKGLWTSKSVEGERELAGLSVALLATVIAYPAPNPQYLLPALPLLAIIGARALAETARRQLKLIGAFCVATMIFALFAYVQMIRIHPLPQQIKEIKYILAVTSPDDYLLAGTWVHGNLYRKDADYFWFQTEPRHGLILVYRDLTGYPYDSYEIVERMEPKLIAKELFADLSDERISGRYVPAEIEGMLIRVR